MDTAVNIIENQIKEWKDKRKHCLGRIELYRKNIKDEQKELETIDTIIGQLSNAKEQIT